jgi:hypothetical protein
MTEILMSDEVRALLGEEGAARVRLARSTTVTNAAFAHPGCAPSVVIDVTDEQMAEAMPDEADMAMTAALVEHGGGVLLPTLLAELEGAAYAAQGPAGTLGELTDVLVSTLLARGFALVTRLRQAPRHAPG